MDARSIAATARNSGVLTGADEIDVEYKSKPYFLTPLYTKRGFMTDSEGKSGRNVGVGTEHQDWPEMPALSKICSCASTLISPIL